MLSMKSLSDALRFVSHASAEKDVRYYLNGVAFEFARYKAESDTPGADHKNTLYLIATDGSRIARATLTLEAGDLPGLDRDAEAFIIDNEAVKAILAVKKPSDKQPVDLTFTTAKGSTGRFLSMDAGATMIRCSLQDGKFPDWRRVFPKRHDIDNGTQNTVYIDSGFIGDACVAINRLHKDSGNRYRACSIAVHADNTVVTAPGFPCGQISDPLVKVMYMRR